MIWILCILVFFLSSCDQKPQVTHYTEIEVHAPQVIVPIAPVVSTIPLTWDVPQGWKQEAGIGIRLATFHSLADDKAIDCSVVALGGMVAGLEANLSRWLGQLGIDASQDHVKQLIVSARDFTGRDGLTGKLFDFTNLQEQGSPTDKSMIVAMITIDKTTVFIKITGSINAVKQNRDNFLKLIGSMTRK